jgi:hypothetical protein
MPSTLSNPSLLLAFGWVNLPMLGWLAAAAAPIVIHLWSRRRFHPMPWAAMQYLLAALQRRQRRMRLEQWLLLTLRTLIVLAVVAAVAQPYFERDPLGFAPGGRTHRVLVIDGSYSMLYKADDKTRFDRAKEMAARIVAESPQGDGFSLVLMATPPRVVVGTPAFEPGQFRQELDNLRAAQTMVDLPATLSAVERLVANAGREVPRLTRHEVFFLTDLGRAGWAPGAGLAAAAEIRRRAASLGAAAKLFVIDLGEPSADNLAVTDLYAEEPIATPAHDVHLRARMKNFGRVSQSRRAVELLVDGRPLAQQSVDLDAGAEKSMVFSHRFETPGDHAVEVRLDAGDRLEIDNRRFLIVRVRDDVRVLCVEGPSPAAPGRLPADYLLDALSPQADDARRGVVRAEAVPESGLLERDLGRYDCVFLRNVAQFTSSEAQVLEGYVGRGGSLVFFLGDRVLADRYNRELGGERAGAPRLLPARLGPVVSDPQHGLDPLEYRHPAVRAFRGHERAGLLTTPIWKYVKLSVADHAARGQARVVLAFANGDPMIVERSVGHGRVVLVATSADLAWSAMPVWPSFLPLVQELLAYCVGSQSQRWNLEVGQSLDGAVPLPAAGQTLSLRRPDGGSESLRPTAQGDYGRFSYAETTQCGIYTARLGSPSTYAESFAVNLDTAESDLTPLGPEELRGQLWPGVPFVYQNHWSLSERPAAGRAGRPGELHLELLYAAFAMLLAETFIAWRFGHHSS